MNNAMYIANEIKNQLFYLNRMAVYVWGTKNMVALAEEKKDFGYILGGLGFSIRTPKIQRGGVVRIYLMADDTYTIKVFRIYGTNVKELGSISYVHFPELITRIDELIEDKKTIERLKITGR